MVVAPVDNQDLDDIGPEDAAPGAEGALLGVDRSWGSRRWRLVDHDSDRAEIISRTHNLPEIVGRVLAARGIDDADIDGYLNPRLRDQLPDPFHLKDMERAAERLADTVMGGERVAVFGDYDVDGATSSALLVRFLRAVGGEAAVYIPDRLAEGYGPNIEALLGLRRDGASLVVTVDCGMTAFEPLAAAADAGLPVIVLDHHIAEETLPAAFAVVNPNRLDETSPLCRVAAVGVTFLAVVAINSVLRRRGWYENAEHPEPDLIGWLDLVALGTVCDVMPLTGLNRAFVSQGLKILGQRRNPGLAALADIARVSDPVTAYHIGFVLGPRINAGGRIGRSDLGADLLVTDDEEEARRLALALDELNAERQSIEAGVMAAAVDQIGDGEDKPILFAAGEGWHPGVIGIVASKLKDRFDKPVVILSVEEGEARASGRSVPGVDLGQAVIAAREAGLVEKGGGHPMAAGFTARADRLTALFGFLSQHVCFTSSACDPAPPLDVFGTLTIGGCTPGLVCQIDRLGPFGENNSEPRFAIAGARVIKADVVGGKHVRCVLSSACGSERLRAIAFRAVGAELGDGLLRGRGSLVHLAGRLRLDCWNGVDQVQLMIDDAAPAAGWSPPKSWPSRQR